MAALLVLLVVFPALGLYDPEQRAWYAAHQGWYWFHLVNIGHAVAGNPPLGWTTHLWSLSVEEQFYMLWPLAVWGLARRGLRWACMALIAGAIAARVFMAAGGTLSPWLNTVTRTDGLAAGSWLAVVARDGDLSRLATRIDRAGAAAVVALAAFWLLIPSLLPKTDPRLLPLTETLLAVAFLGMLVRALTPIAPLPRAMTHPWLRSFGRYSYGIYVVHLPLRGLLTRANVTPARVGGGSLLSRTFYLGLLIGLSYGLAWVSWHGWEQHWLRLKDRFRPAARLEFGADAVLVDAAGATEVAVRPTVRRS